MMKRQRMFKQVLSIILSIALVVGMITISEPNRVNASDAENLITNGGFDSTTDWTNNSDPTNPIEVLAQQQVQDMHVVDAIDNGDFETDNIASWGSVHSLPIKIATEDNNRFLEVSNVISGKVFHVLSGLTPGETYQISFDIKGSSDISFHLFCGDEGLSNAVPFYTWKTATTTWTTHEMSYTVPTGNAGQLVFQCVGGNGEMFVDNFSASQEKVRTEYSNVIANADFETGTPDLWGSVHSLPISIVEDGENKVLKVSNVISGKVFHVLSGLTPGETYQISFDIKGSSDISFHLFCGDEGLSNAVPFYTWKTATTTWTTHEMSYTVPTGNAGQLVFQCVGGSGEMFVDNFCVNTEQIAMSYTEGIGTCLGAEPDNVLVMKNMTEVTYPVTITAGKTYEYSFSTKTEATGNDFDFGFASGENVICNNSDSTEISTDWNAVSGTFTATVDAASIQFTRSGEGSLFLDDIILKESVSTPEPTPTEPTPISVGFKMVEVDNSWYFTADNIAEVTGNYYMANIIVDDNEVTVPLEKTSDGFVIWVNFFGIIETGTTAPSLKLAIPAETLIQQIDPNTTGWSTPVEGGQTLKMSETLVVVKTDTGWKLESEQTPPDEPTPPGESTTETIAFEYKNVEVDNSWYFTADNIAEVTGSYYIANIIVDDNEVTVPLEKTSDGFVIWVNFFGIIETGTTAPSLKLAIPAETLIQQIDPNTTGWSTPVEGGQTLKIEEELVVVKTDTGWEVEGNDTPTDPDTPTEPDTPVEPTVVTLGNAMGIYNAGTENEVFSVMIAAPEEMKTVAVTVAGTLTADSTSKEHVVYIPGNGEIFFYTDGASETLLISKDTEFASQDGTTVIRFDKDYEIDLVNQAIYEQGNKPVKKEALDLTIAFDKIVNDSFMFTWKMYAGLTPEAGFYRTVALIDGEETTILIEYYPGDNAFFIYPHCFGAVPTDGREGYPTESFELQEGTELTPVVTGTWVETVEGQPYNLTDKVSVVKEGNSWLDADYMEEISTQDPLEVTIVFDYIKGSAAIFQVILPGGKEIDDIYGDWTTARGLVLRGVKEAEEGAYSYTSENAAYSITGSTFYMDGLRLNELDALQINAGTMVYADETCNSTQPIKITNQVRIIRDANDEWVIDKTFTTEYDAVTEGGAASDNASENETKEEQKEVISEKKEEKEELISPEKEDKNYAKSNIRYHDKADDDDTTVNVGNTPVVTIAIASLGLLVLVCIILIMIIKKPRDKRAQGE